MAYQEVRGGPDTTSGQAGLRGGFVEHRTAPTVVSPKVIGNPKELAFLQQRRRAADRVSTVVAPRAIGSPSELSLLQQRGRTPDRVPRTVRRVVPLTKKEDIEVKPFKGGNNTGELILATNPMLDELIHQINWTRPNWEYLRGKLARHSTRTNPEGLHGFLAELHVNTVLQTLAGYKKWSKVLKLIDLHNRITPNYSFSTDRGALYASSRRTKQDVAEYDAFFEIDGLPTVIEVKARGINGEGVEQVDAAMGDAHIRRIFAPLQELYGPNTYFGYALITVPEQDVSPSPVRKTFQEEGGLVTTMNTSLVELKRQAQRTVFDLRKSA